MQNTEKRRGRPVRNRETAEKYIKTRATAAEVEELKSLCTALGMSESEAIRAGVKLLGAQVDRLRDWPAPEGMTDPDGFITTTTDLPPNFKAGDVLALVHEDTPSAGVGLVRQDDGTLIVGTVYHDADGTMKIIRHPFGTGGPEAIAPGSYLGRVAGFYRRLPAPDPENRPV